MTEFSNKDLRGKGPAGLHSCHLLSGLEKWQRRPDQPTSGQAWAGQVPAAGRAPLSTKTSSEEKSKHANI